MQMLVWVSVYTYLEGNGVNLSVSVNYCECTPAFIFA